MTSLLLIGLLVLAPPAAGGAGPALDCARCHQNPGMRPALQTALGVPRSLFIDPAEFQRSRHYTTGKKTRCIDCHPDIKTYPHGRAARLRCSDCHADDKKPMFHAIESSLRQSVHARLDCNECHDVHRNKPAREMTLREKNAGCLKCHEFGLAGRSAAVAAVPLAEFHSWHPQARLHLERMACVVCHTELRPDGRSDKHLIRPRQFATARCETCHAGDSRVAAYLIDVGPAAAENRTPEQLLERIYLVGGTREPWIEIIGGSLVMLTMIGVAGHALGRAGLHLRRRGREG